MEKKIMFNAESLIGKNKEEAITIIKDSKLVVRIRNEDGKAYVGTCDFRIDRINLYIENGIITKANVG